MNKVKNIKYIDSNNFTNHLLETKSFDYFGSQTAEKEIQYFIKYGNILFEYNSKIIRFGKGLWEEDAREIIEKIKDFKI